MIDEQIKELLIHHLPGRHADTIACYDMWEHQDWKDENTDGTINGFISYFFLDFRFDIIITAAKDNKFSKAQWRVLRDTIQYRTKPLRIQSDPYNKVLQRVVKKYGGKFVEDEIFFPAPGYKYE